MNITTINPATGQRIHEYPLIDSNDIDRIIEQTQQAFLSWKNSDFSTRQRCLQRTAELLQTHQKRYAALITQEMGKPITASNAEIEKCARVCNYYAENSEQLLKPRVIKTDWQKSYVSYQASGIIFAIMPWNFPFWQVFRFVAPNLMAGQACLLKHAPITTGCALAIEALLQQAGFPRDLFRTLIIDVEQAKQVIQHPHVTGVTLTGSERAGASVASEAGKAIKKSVLELGGNDPYLILADADLERAADTCLTARLNNSGQVCIAAKRIIAVEPVYEKFKALILEKISAYRMGDPLDHNTQLGPLARADLRDTVHQQLQQSIAQGANLALGGEIPSGPGFYYPVTVLTEVATGMAAFDDEVFGPVISLIQADDEPTAIRLANQSRFGLGAALFTQDIARGEQIACEQLQAGSCAVNALVTSDPRLPFGGSKQSGYGRELSAEGLYAFMNLKTITIA